MKIAIVSDLHLEFDTITLENTPNADVLILGGDICIADDMHHYPDGGGEIVSQHQSRAKMYREFFKQVSGSFKHVIQIAGNHEYYHHNWENTIPTLKTEASKHSNFHFLEKDTITIENITFIGTTLWTNCNNRDPLTEFHLKSHMNDYNVVRVSNNGYRKLQPIDTIKEHDRCLDYIKNVIDNDRTKQYVVCTHHAPSRKSIHPRYSSDDLMNGGYMTALIMQ